MILGDDDGTTILDGQSFQYVLKQKSEPLTVVPTLQQDWTFCPNTC